MCIAITVKKVHNRVILLLLCHLIEARTRKIYIFLLKFAKPPLHTQSPPEGFTRLYVSSLYIAAFPIILLSEAINHIPIVTTMPARQEPDTERQGHISYLFFSCSAGP